MSKWKTATAISHDPVSVLFIRLLSTIFIYAYGSLAFHGIDIPCPENLFQFESTHFDELAIQLGFSREQSQLRNTTFRLFRQRFSSFILFFYVHLYRKHDESIRVSGWFSVVETIEKAIPLDGATKNTDGDGVNGVPPEIK